MVFPVDVEIALSAVSDALRPIREVKSVRRTPGEPLVTFDYLKFRGQIGLVCLQGEEGHTGWWPTVALDGTRTVIAPWRIARLLAFYARLPGRAKDALAGVSPTALRIRRPEVVGDTNCP